MIQPHELKIGVTQVWDIYKNDVRMINSQDIFYSDIDRKNFNAYYKPIEFTDEIIEKMGGKITPFKVSQQQTDSNSLHYGYDFCVFKNICFRIQRSSTGIIALYLEDYSFPLVSVHHLQDFYFSMSGNKIIIPVKNGR
ncbi:hypothetical protein [uncultured Chryseobacterium sp.]|uniref:hypothetical protein n=1 Tax=uncultured Chryseobacterium sp. TaxID=259322 RepID=UPI0025ECBF59|nr:hypothetical protein [uncultured Chryseobacterium sp.]